MYIRKFIIPLLSLAAACLAAPQQLCAQAATDDTVPIRLEGMTEAQARSIGQEQPAEKADPADTPQRNIEEELSFVEIRRRMLEERAVPVTPANRNVDVRQGDGGESSGRSARPPRFEDGQGILDKLVAIDRDEMGWLAATFLRAKRDDNGDLPTVRLLQCPMLEAMETELAGRPETLFQISGEVLLFGNQAYLMLRRASIWEGPRPEAAGRVVEPGETVTQTPPSPTNDPAATTETADPDATLSETIAETTDTEADGSTDDLMAALMRDQPGRALPAPPTTPETPEQQQVESVAPVTPKPLPAGERDLVADRTVRIVHSEDGRWWEVRFVGDNTLREPPMRALPSGLLAKAIALMHEIGGADMKFRVTGEVVRYKGRRYLLLRRLIRQRDMGQF